MSSKLNHRPFSPFLSVILVIVTLLTVVFVKMEIVREGYELLKMSRVEKQERDLGHRLETDYSQLLRPERLDKIGTERLALTRAQQSQVILMASGMWAVRQ